MHLTTLFRQVTATFTPLPYITVSGLPGTYGTLQSAYGDAPDDAVISMQSQIFPENVTLGDAKNVTVEGGYAADFRAQNGISMIDGSITIARGSVTAGFIGIE